MNTSTKKRASRSEIPDSEVQEQVPTAGSGSVFSDMGVGQSDLEEAKTDLAVAIVLTLSERGRSQLERAEILGVDQSTMSFLENYQLRRFTLDRLARYSESVGIPWRDILAQSRKAREE